MYDDERSMREEERPYKYLYFLKCVLSIDRTYVQHLDIAAHQILLCLDRPSTYLFELRIEERTVW